MSRKLFEVARILLIIVMMMVLLTAGRSDAAFTVTINQAGNNVLAIGSGSLDLTNVINGGLTSIVGPSIRPSVGSLSIGAVDFERAYRPFFLTDTGFGAEAFSENATGTGFHVGILAGVGLYLSDVYVSKTQFTSTSTFFNTTVARLGLTSGTYTYAYSATRGGPVLDTFTIQVGPAVVPEPSSVTLCGIAVLSGVVIRLARRKRSK